MLLLFPGGVFMEYESLEVLRKRIDEVDETLIELLRERMKLAQQIGEVKHMLGLPIRDHDRVAEVIHRAGMFKEIFSAIVELCGEAERR